jgi:hypothetical protein
VFAILCSIVTLHWLAEMWLAGATTRPEDFTQAG